jgi:hypothetical protein
MDDQRSNLVGFFLQTRVDPSGEGAATQQVTVAPLPTPSCNSSTTLLQTLYDRLILRGWGRATGPLIPQHADDIEELPERPLDLGSGQWR